MPATLDLTELLHVDDIHFDFRAASIIEAIPLLLRPALERRGEHRQRIDEIIASAIRREEDTPTRCGPLALPHARHAGVADFILSLGVNSAGILPGHPEPRLVFAFVSPEERREQHLQLLASLARLSQNEWIVEKIAGASAADQVVDALRSAGV
ncbi:MAG TPA: PTS sugar transporter subunit IIA [Thermoanaerobaculia bacterium]